MQTYLQGLAGIQLFSVYGPDCLSNHDAVLCSKDSTFIYPLSPNLTFSLLPRSSVPFRRVPTHFAFSLGLLPIPVSPLTHPSSSSSLLIPLPSSRSLLSDTTVSSRPNRFLQFTADLPVLGCGYRAVPASFHHHLPRCHPSPAGREHTAGGRPSELTA